MGGASSYCIYGRIRMNDKYKTITQLAPGSVEVDAMGMFKHVIYEFLMEKNMLEMKSLYLYDGNFTRLCKCTKKGELIFSSVFTKMTYLTCEERLPPQHWPLLERCFHRVFDTTHPTSSKIQCTKKEEPTL